MPQSSVSSLAGVHYAGEPFGIDRVKVSARAHDGLNVGLPQIWARAHIEGWGAFPEVLMSPVGEETPGQRRPLAGAFLVRVAEVVWVTESWSLDGYRRDSSEEFRWNLAAILMIREDAPGRLLIEEAPDQEGRLILAEIQAGAGLAELAGIDEASLPTDPEARVWARACQIEKWALARPGLVEKWVESGAGLGLDLHYWRCKADAAHHAHCAAEWARRLVLLRAAPIVLPAIEGGTVVACDGVRTVSKCAQEATWQDDGVLLYRQQHPRWATDSLDKYNVNEWRYTETAGTLDADGTITWSYRDGRMSRYFREALAEIQAQTPDLGRAIRWP